MVLAGRREQLYPHEAYSEADTLANWRGGVTVSCGVCTERKSVNTASDEFCTYAYDSVANVMMA